MPRLTVRVGVVATSLLLVAVACGESSTPEETATTRSPDAAAESAAIGPVQSSDDVVTLDIPDGAVPNGTEITITPTDLPAELAELEGTALVYDLQPSGLEFSEPATIRFALDVDDDSDGVPAVLIVLQDEAGKAEALESRAERDGSTVIVTATLVHFSRALLYVDDRGEYFRLRPSSLRIPVNRSDTVQVERSLREGEGFKPFPLVSEYLLRAFVTPTATSRISVELTESALTVECGDEPTNGMIVDAYEVIVAAEEQPELLAVSLFFGVNLPQFTPLGVLTGDVECTEAEPGTGDGDTGAEQGGTDVPALQGDLALLVGQGWSTETGNKTAIFKVENIDIVDGETVVTGTVVITADGEEATGTFKILGTTITITVAHPVWDCPLVPVTYDWFISSDGWLQISIGPSEECFARGSWWGQDIFNPISLP